MACHEYLHKKNAPHRFELGEPAELSGMAKELARQGHEHEARVFETIKATCASWVHIDASADKDQREAQTVSALFNPEVDIILGATIGARAEAEISRLLGLHAVENTGRVSSPDILIRGSRGHGPTTTWLAVDVKAHSAIEDNKSNVVWQASLSETLTLEGDELQGRLREEDALQLAHYVTHLNQLGIGSGSTLAGIIGRDGSSIVWADLSATTFGRGSSAETAMDRYLRKFAESEFVVEQAIKRNLDQTIPAPAIPMYDGNAKKCPTCEFKKVCLDEMKQYKGSGHVTVLAGVTPAKAATLAVDSIAELANELGSDAELAQRAKVYLSGIPEVLIGRTLAVPTFDIEIDIDLENSQAALQEIGFDASVEPDRLYLYGYITHDQTVHGDWTLAPRGTFEDYSGTREGEHTVYASMWNYLHDQIAQAEAVGKSIGVFHYSQHENTWWRKWASNFADLPGTPSIEDVEEFIRRYMHDLYPVAQKVIFPPSPKSPICNYSIKTLAPLAGFEWYADDAGGANSLLKYREAVGANRDLALAAQAWLRKYNVDDVQATMALRNWLRDSGISRDVQVE